MIIAEGWNDPQTWMQIADRFGVAVLVIFAFGCFIAACMVAIWRIYKSFEPLVKRKLTEVADAHNKFVNTAADSIDIHAKANAGHAAAHVISADSMKALSEAVEGWGDQRYQVSDLMRIVHGSLAAVGEGLEALETMHKDNEPMLRTIAKFRIKLASLREAERRKRISDSDH